jgi:hypothetical protein
MRLNDILSIIRKNSKLILFAALGCILLSAALGLAIGLLRNPSQPDFLDEIERMAEESRPGEKDIGFIMPAPIVPGFGGEDLDHTFYFDRHPEFIDNIEMVPVKISELILYRKKGLQLDLKPFEFMGEELDVLTTQDELAEP